MGSGFEINDGRTIFFDNYGTFKMDRKTSQYLRLLDL